MTIKNGICYEIDYDADEIFRLTRWFYIMFILSFPKNYYIYLLIIKLILFYAVPCHATVHGIYLTQSTVESAKMVKYFIKQAKKHNIDTFIIDINRKSNRYKKNIKKIIDNQIHIVARVVVFPGGGTSKQVKNKNIINKKLALANYVLNLGVQEIQLDYIRYKPTQPRSYQNTKNIYQVIKQFKLLTTCYNAKLQVDIFGIVSYKPNNYIGQNVRLFADIVDVFCPMVYPSHYEPYDIHTQNPYKTVYNSLTALKKQLRGYLNKEIIAYIELSNYRHYMNISERIRYIREQIKATKKTGISGWYAWSPNNKYSVLFRALSQ